jgi:hypothetical protein
MNLTSLNAYVMAEKKSFAIFNNSNFEEVQKKQMVSTSGVLEDFYIISMAVSKEEDKIALLLGK